MKTEDLIVQLAQKARPVTPLAPPVARLAAWTVGAVIFVVLGVAVIGIRVDGWAKLQQARYLVELLLTIAIGILAAAAALVLGIPAAERTRLQRWLPLVAAGAWAGLLGRDVLLGGSVAARLLQLPIHLACILEIAGLAILPGLILFGMLRRSAPLRLEWAAGLSGLAALAVAAAGTQLICPVDDPAHLFIGHFIPVAGLAIVGAVLGRRRLNWLASS
ncbi:MAG TPA: NrsF family protein [Vicinamibacterales bacterium]|nr:NrsF family protein [Vicinamibacterales bacterium]